MGGSEPDWYAVLGARPGSSHDEIRRSHRRAVKEQHPDRTQHLPEPRRAALAAAFVEATSAWAVLGDPQARAAYDARRAAREAQREAARRSSRERQAARTTRTSASSTTTSTPWVPQPRSAPAGERPRGEDRHEHLAVSEERLAGGITVTDGRDGATYGPFREAGVYRIRAHGHRSAAAGAPGDLFLHVTLQDPAPAPPASPTPPASAESRASTRARWGAALRWRALAAAGVLVVLAQELVQRR